MAKPVISDIQAPREGVFRLAGVTGGSAGFTAANVPVTIAYNTGLNYSASVTPTYNCWWPVHFHTLFTVADQAWYRINVTLTLSPNDAVLGAGSSPVTSVMDHGAASDWVYGAVDGMFALNANTAYTVTAQITYIQGGTWQYYGGASGHGLMFSTGIFQR